MVLTDAGTLRFEAMSACLVVFLVAAGGFRVIWNEFGRGVAQLPELSYRRAVSLMVGAGLLAWPVLVIVASGGDSFVPPAWGPPPAGDARTGPDAGPSASGGEPAPTADAEPARRARLLALKDALWTYAQYRGGQFPPDKAALPGDGQAWVTADPSGMSFLYTPAFPASRAGSGSSVVAFEPGIFGAERLALFSDGSIRKLPLAAIRTAVSGGH